MRFALALFAAAALCGCAAEKVKLRVVVPAKTRIVGVRGIAVGAFHVENLDGATADGRGRNWNRTPLTEAQLGDVASGVKNDLMSALAETPHYNIVDLDGMERIYSLNDLAGLVGKPTFKPGAVDAILFGRVWVGYLEADGLRHEKRALEHWNYRGQQPELLRSTEQLLTSEYKTSSAVVVVQYTAVRLQPRLEVLLVSTSIHSLRQDEGGGITVQTTRGGALGALMGAFGNRGASEGKTETAGGKPAGGSVPLPLEAFSYLSHEAAREFVESISPTTTEYTLEIAKGDETSSNLIRSGAYREASKRLREITKGTKQGTVSYKEEKDKAADYYNLGLSFEAQGPAYFEDAVLAYRKAVEADPEEMEYATGLGRIAKLLEGTNLIDMQRSAMEEGR